MKKNTDVSELSWGRCKRLAEKYLANPFEEKVPQFLEEPNGRFQEWYREIFDGVRHYMAEKCSEDKIKNSSFKLWFQRQNARNRFQSSVIRHMEGLYYVPVAFELTDGCSVGCDFCCLAAKPLRSVYRYTAEHAEEWQRILKETREVLGDIAGSGICYFATEPFDNPDYEKFLRDFRELMGYNPHTTTATADRNADRIKAFLEQLGEKELAHAAVRFSIVSLEQLERIHSRFSEEELQYVELVMNNPQSGNCYSKAGRARQLSEKMKKKKFLDTVSSICTNGFVVNMARRTVMLMTAHRPDEQHPLGMKILAEKSFADAEEYQMILTELIESWVPESMPMDMPMELAGYITFERDGYRLKIQGDKISRTLTMGEKEQEGFQMLLEKAVPIKEILHTLEMTEYEKKRFLKNVELCYQAGYLEERRR